MKIACFSTFDAVLRTGSLAGGAAQMHITPSAVSMQMRQLEHYFGKPLFDRSGLQVRPTAFALEAGMVLRQTLAQMERLRQHTTLAVDGSVRLGVIETLQPTLLPGVVRRLRDRHPALTVHPVRGRSVELLAAIKSGQLDAAVLMQPEAGGSQRLHWSVLTRKDFVLVAPPEAKQQALADLFAQHAWIRFDPQTNTGRLASRYVRAHAPVTRETIDLQSVQAIVAMVSAGLGVSVVPEPDPRMCVAYPVRIVRLGARPPSMQIAFVARKPDASQRRLVAVLAAVKDAIDEMQPGTTDAAPSRKARTPALKRANTSVESSRSAPGD